MSAESKSELKLRLRRAERSDVGSIVRLIKELAVYEKEPLENVIITEEMLLRDGFGDIPMFQCILAEEVPEDASAQPLAIGMALYFYTYSTWEGPMLFLEDLVISPDYRGRGAGMKLLRSLVEIAQARGCRRVQWSVLDWNEPAIKFYSRIGAKLLKEWVPVRLDVNGISNFLSSFSQPNEHPIAP